MNEADVRERTVARRVLLAGLALGLLGELAFDGPAFGIGVPTVVAAVLVAGWSVRRRGRALDPLDAWLPVSAIVLALLVGVRADPFVAGLDILVAIGLIGASLAAMSGLAVTRRRASVIVAAFVASRNTERVIDPSLVPLDGHSGLDAAYLAILPDDAIPILVAALPRLPPREAGEVRSILLTRRMQLQVDAAYGSPFAWNIGRERARETLATLP